MTIVRRLARPMLAASFVQEGLDAVLHPAKRTERARPLVEAVAGPLNLPKDPELLIRANGAVMAGAAALFALGRLGGALLAAVDTQGRPGLAWRGKHAAEHLGTSAKRTTRAARREAKRAAKDARTTVGV